MEKELREKIAKLDYQWRFCGVPDEYETEWKKEGECIKQSCREFAKELLTLIQEAGYVKVSDNK